MSLLFNPLDDRWFALMCSFAFGCWWMWMLLMSKHWAHIPVRRVPLGRVLWVLLLAAIWPVVAAAQFSLGYDWSQFGSDPAEDHATRLPATVTGQNRGERVRADLASREIDVRHGASRAATLAALPVLILDVLGLRFIVEAWR